MRLTFKITTFSEATSGYHLTAYTEGELRVTMNGAVFLEAQGVLLIELAVVLHKWLLALEEGFSDFYYSSMDFEEEPILALNFDPTNDCLILESVWATSDPVPVSLDEAKEAARAYLAELRADLKAQHGVDLDEVIEAAMMD